MQVKAVTFKCQLMLTKNGDSKHLKLPSKDKNFF